MAITIGNKTFRNLEEQVYENADDISKLGTSHDALQSEIDALSGEITDIKGDYALKESGTLDNPTIAGGTISGAAVTDPVIASIKPDADHALALPAKDGTIATLDDIAAPSSLSDVTLEGTTALPLEGYIADEGVLQNLYVYHEGDGFDSTAAYLDGLGVRIDYAYSHSANKVLHVVIAGTLKSKANNKKITIGQLRVYPAVQDRMVAIGTFTGEDVYSVDQLDLYVDGANSSAPITGENSVQFSKYGSWFNINININGLEEGKTYLFRINKTFYIAENLIHSSGTLTASTTDTSIVSTLYYTTADSETQQSVNLSSTAVSLADVRTFYVVTTGTIGISGNILTDSSYVPVIYSMRGDGSLIVS